MLQFTPETSKRTIIFVKNCLSSSLLVVIVVSVADKDKVVALDGMATIVSCNGPGFTSTLQSVTPSCGDLVLDHICGFL